MHYVHGLDCCGRVRCAPAGGEHLHQQDGEHVCIVQVRQRVVCLEMKAERVSGGQKVHRWGAGEGLVLGAQHCWWSQWHMRIRVSEGAAHVLSAFRSFASDRLAW
jgi:hypothetical protein